MSDTSGTDYKALWENERAARKNAEQRALNAEQRATSAENKLKRISEINDRISQGINEMTSVTDHVKKYLKEGP